MSAAAWLWLKVARACYRVGFAGQDAGEWCYARYLRARYGRRVVP